MWFCECFLCIVFLFSKWCLFKSWTSKFWWSTICQFFRLFLWPKIFFYPKVKDFLLCFLLRVLGFLLRIMIHFEFIFVCIYINLYIYIFCAYIFVYIYIHIYEELFTAYFFLCRYSVVTALFIEKDYSFATLLSIEITCVALSKINWLCCCGSIYVLSILFHESIYLPLCQK